MIDILLIVCAYVLCGAIMAGVLVSFDDHEPDDATVLGLIWPVILVAILIHQASRFSAYLRDGPKE